LDQFCATTGVSRVTARRYLTNPHLGVKNVSKIDRRSHRPTKYSTASKRVLVRLWHAMMYPCGKYMHAMLPEWIPQLEAHHELVYGQHDYTPEVREQLLQMSAATIDRYLKQHRQGMQLKGLSATRSGAMLRTSITIRKAGDEVEHKPGFLECDTVAHCGPTLKGEFARTLTATCVHTGWTHLEVMRNNARVHMLAALERLEASLPFNISGLDCDNGSEFINDQVIQWANERTIFFTRSRPYKKNDQAVVESKNNHIVRKYGFYYRYDTPGERDILALLWQAVMAKMNFFTPTRKPVGWKEDAKGRKHRQYDAPKTPYQRLLESGTLSTVQQHALRAQYSNLNPMELTCDIVTYQDMLIRKAKSKTETLTAEVENTKQNRKKRQTGGVKIHTA
ncbi:integrase catalytic domain-containing protein, partial [Micrococcoides hystricis]